MGAYIRFYTLVSIFFATKLIPIDNNHIFVADCVFGDASRVQVPRHERLVRSEDMLDAAAAVQGGRRQAEGPLRRRLQGDGQQRRQPAQQQRTAEQQRVERRQPEQPFASRPQQPHAPSQRQLPRLALAPQHGHRRPGGRQERQVQLPAEAREPGPQNARRHRPGVFRAVAQFLRSQPQAGHRRHQGAPLQRDLHRAGRVRAHVLRPGLRHAGNHREGALRVHLPLVLRGRVQNVSQDKDYPHMQIGA